MSQVVRAVPQPGLHKLGSRYTLPVAAAAGNTYTKSGYGIAHGGGLGGPVLLDNFNRADSGTLGSNYSTAENVGPSPVQMQVIGNAAGLGATESTSIWIANTFGVDQEASATVTVYPGGINAHLYLWLDVLAVSPTAMTSYLLDITMVSDGSLFLGLYRANGGSYTQLSADEPIPGGGAVNDTFTFRRVGNKLYALKNGVYMDNSSITGSWSSAGITDGSPLSNGGYIGFGGRDNSSMRFDNFTGGSVGGAVTGGPKQVDHYRSSYGVVGLVGAGASASVFVESGFGTVGGVGSGSKTVISGGGTTYTKTGYATAGLIGSGPSASVFVESGAGVLSGVGAGASASAFVESGAGIAGTVGAGPSASVFVESGSGIAGTVGAGSSASVFVESGAGITGLVGSGSSQKIAAGGTTYTKAGYATTGGIGAGPDQDIFSESGSATVGLVGSGASSTDEYDSGSGFIGLIGSGPSQSIFQDTSAGIAGTVGAGSSASVFVRSGYGTVGCVGTGALARTHDESGRGVVGTVGSGSSQKDHVAITKSGYGACGLTALGQKRLLYTKSGYGIIEGTGTGLRAISWHPRQGTGIVGIDGYGHKRFRHYDFVMPPKPEEGFVLTPIDEGDFVLIPHEPDLILS